jgi:CHAD domain-containing protein
VNPTLRAALFLRNNDLVLWALQKRKGNLLDRVAALTDPAQVAEELYTSILSRPPVAEEKAELAKYLTKHAASRDKALGHYAWAMLSSMEFFTNH